MIKATKKDTGSFIYMRMQKHHCPKCGEVMKVVKIKKTVKANTKEAVNFDFSAAGHPLAEKIKFIWFEFKCPKCEVQYTEDALRAIEKKAKKDAAEAKKAEKRCEKAAKKANKKAEKKAASKENEVETDSVEE